MNVLTKRFFPGLLVIALVMALAAPTAFADDVNTQTTIEGTYYGVTIDVTVPESGSAYINPYGLSVAYSNGETGASYGSLAETPERMQIVTMPLFIKNNTDLELEVSATASGKASGGMTLADSPLAAGEDSKSAFVYLQFSPTELETSLGTLTLPDKQLYDASAGISMKAAYTEYANWTQAYDADKDIVLQSSPEEAKHLGYLKGVETTEGATPDITVISKYTKGSIAMVRLAGEVVTEPSDKGWSESDTFTATIAFTFKPANTLLKAETTAGEIWATAGDLDATTGSTGLIITAVDENVDFTGATGMNVTAESSTGSITAVTVVTPATVNPDNSKQLMSTVTVTGGAVGDTVTIKFEATLANGIKYDGKVTLTLKNLHD